MPGKHLRSLMAVCMVAVFLMLAAGCGSSEREGVTPLPTGVVNPTSPRATTALSPTVVVLPTAPVPPSPTETPTMASALPTAPPTVPPDAETEPPYDDSGGPVRLLASYFNAVNRQEYLRAWEYWENPPNPSYEDFVQGYAETASVLLAVRPPTQYDGAAGSEYAAVPSLLLATHVDGSQHAFVGCYVARHPIADAAGVDIGWSLYSATVAAAPGNRADVTLLAGPCDFPPPDQPEPLYNDRKDPVRLLASYFNAVNRQEYQRAWEYWENPPSPSYEDFVQGYADTASVLLAVRPPTLIEGAAGSQYAAVPSLLIATHTDASVHAFVGCYVAWRANPGLSSASAEAGWSLDRASVSAIPGHAADATLLEQACAMP